MEADGTFSYTPRWTFNDAEERQAFEAIVADIIAALERDQSIHVYHYAPYELVAFKRLMGRYASWESELDRLSSVTTRMTVGRPQRSPGFAATTCFTERFLPRAGQKKGPRHIAAGLSGRSWLPSKTGALCDRPQERSWGFRLASGVPSWKASDPARLLAPDPNDWGVR